MARQRTPLAKAKLMGEAGKKPGRFAGRSEPKTKPLGRPSKWMVDENQLAAWKAFKQEIPWLGESDRTCLEGACVLRARLMKGEEVGVQALGQLRQYLNDMGATPTARSKIGAPEEDDDGLGEFLN